jgi:hypothetical protein
MELSIEKHSVKLLIIADVFYQKCSWFINDKTTNER